MTCFVIFLFKPEPPKIIISFVSVLITANKEFSLLSYKTFSLSFKYSETDLISDLNEETKR